MPQLDADLDSPSGLSRIVNLASVFPSRCRGLPGPSSGSHNVIGFFVLFLFSNFRKLPTQTYWKQPLRWERRGAPGSGGPFQAIPLIVPVARGRTTASNLPLTPASFRKPAPLHRDARLSANMPADGRGQSLNWFGAVEQQVGVHLCWQHVALVHWLHGVS